MHSRRKHACVSLAFNGIFAGMNSQKNRWGSFINPGVTDGRRSLWQVFLWLVGYYKDPAALLAPPEGFVFPTSSFSKNGEAALQWVGHSTFLIEYAGKNVLTDPMWSDRASPFRYLGPKRHQQPGISLEALPPIDYILISHNHYDHLDEHTCLALYKLHPNVRFIVPLGLKNWFLKRGISNSNIEELDWWQIAHTEFMRVTAVPSQHFSGRSIFDRNKTLWCGYVVEFAKKCLYFAGDTGYNEHYFRLIAKHFPDIDISLIPIGAYAPRAFMKPAHITPKEALQIHQDVASKLSIGCHYGTFHLSDEPLSRPPYDLYLALQENKSFDSFCLMHEGQKIAW